MIWSAYRRVFFPKNVSAAKWEGGKYPGGSRVSSLIFHKKYEKLCFKGIECATLIFCDRVAVPNSQFCFDRKIISAKCHTVLVQLVVVYNLLS